jgi:integrase
VAKRRRLCLADDAPVDISAESYCGYASVESVQTAIERLRDKNKEKTVKLPALSAYSFRHKVTTVLRKRRLSEDEIGTQLGHRRESARTTAGYGEWDPDYLLGVAGALDAWFVKLQAKVMGKSLFAVPVVENPKVRKLRKAW